jgi:modulator of FtsH protease HflC
MKRLAVTIFIAIIVITLGLYLVSFQVRETESAMVTTFSKPTSQITEPGWYFKWPFPIQQVHKFDSRKRVFVPEVEETRTAGGEPIIVNTYVVWKISEPLDFFNAVKTVDSAENELLRSRIRDTQNNVIGRHYFSEFINSDPNKIKFNEIQNEMLNNLKVALAGAKYGIEITALGIKQLKVSQDVSKAVFERMKSDRNGQAQKLISEGTADATTIRTGAKTKSDELIAAADARARQIKGEGEARAATYYKLLDKEPELAAFLLDLNALQSMLETRTTLILPTDKAPFNLLKGIPPISSTDPNKPQN